MEIKKEKLDNYYAVKFFIEENNKKIASGFLYLIQNEFHDEPYGLMEDIYVSSKHRGKGIGTKIVNMIINEAKNRGCYKLIAQSRYGKPKVHGLYEKLGFNDHGKNFRMNFIDSKPKDRE
jgi:GNAT superfamily N-acetyltransferase